MLSFRQFTESVQLDTSENDKEITLHKIVVDKDSRNQGVGSTAMRKLTNDADAKGKRIVLTPDASFGGSVSRLKKFYKSHGFIENKGRSRDFSTQHSMIREPRENIKEAIDQEEIHRNPSITKLKALARNSKYGDVRYAIDHNNNVWAGDSEHHVHAEFGDGSQAQNVGSHKVVGYIQYHNGDFIHNSFVKGTGLKERASHPFIDRMEKHGIINGGG